MHGEIVCREYCIKLIRQQDVCHVFMGLEGQLVNLGARHSRAIYFHTILILCMCMRVQAGSTFIRWSSMNKRDALLKPNLFRQVDDIEAGELYLR